MKHLTEKFNESYNITLGQVSTINEAWGSTKHYKAELEKIFADYEKKKHPHHWTSHTYDLTTMFSKSLSSRCTKWTFIMVSDPSPNTASIYDSIQPINSNKLCILHISYNTSFYTEAFSCIKRCLLCRFNWFSMRLSNGSKGCCGFIYFRTYHKKRRTVPTFLL